MGTGIAEGIGGSLIASGIVFVESDVRTRFERMSDVLATRTLGPLPTWGLADEWIDQSAGEVGVVRGGFSPVAVTIRGLGTAGAIPASPRRADRRRTPSG